MKDLSSQNCMYLQNIVFEAPTTENDGRMTVFLDDHQIYVFGISILFIRCFLLRIISPLSSSYAVLSGNVF